MLLLWQPALAVDLGFALSVAATAALLLIAPGWARRCADGGVPPALAEAVAVAAAAHLVTAPLIVAISGRISLVAIPANVLAEPVVAAATVLGVLAAVISVLWLPVARLFAQLAGWPCRWLVWVAEYFGRCPVPRCPGRRGGRRLGCWRCCWRSAGGCAAGRGPRRLAPARSWSALLVQIPVRAVVVGLAAGGLADGRLRRRPG